MIKDKMVLMIGRMHFSSAWKLHTLVSRNLGLQKIQNFGKFCVFPWPAFSSKWEIPQFSMTGPLLKMRNLGFLWATTIPKFRRSRLYSHARRCWILCQLKKSAANMREWSTCISIPFTFIYAIHIRSKTVSLRTTVAVGSIERFSNNQTAIVASCG